MSGGSYDYLYCVVHSGDSLELLVEKLEMLERMCNRLKELPNAESARQESVAVLHEVKDYIRLQEAIEDSILIKIQNLARTHSRPSRRKTTICACCAALASTRILRFLRL